MLHLRHFIKRQPEVPQLYNKKTLKSIGLKSFSPNKIIIVPGIRHSKRLYTNKNEIEEEEIEHGFVPRKKAIPPDDILKRMYEMQNKINKTATESTTYLPELLIFNSNETGWLKAFYATFCLASFPLHIYGFFLVPNPLLVIIPLSGSLVWLWWLNQSARSTMKSMTLLKGHKEAQITHFTFLGFTKNLTVETNRLYAGISKIGMDKLKNTSVNRPLSEAIGSIGVDYVDIYYDKLNYFKEPIRKRLVIDSTKVTVLSTRHFLTFTRKPVKDFKTKVYESLISDS